MRALCPELEALLERWDEFLALEPFMVGIEEALEVVHGNKSRAAYILPALERVVKGAKESKTLQPTQALKRKMQVCFSTIKSNLQKKIKHRSINTGRY